MEQLDITKVDQDQIGKDQRVLMTVMKGPFSIRIWEIARDAINETEGFRVCDPMEAYDNGERVRLKIYDEQTGRVAWAACMWDVIDAFGDGRPDRECDIAERLFLAYVGQEADRATHPKRTEPVKEYRWCGCGEYLKDTPHTCPKKTPVREA